MKINPEALRALRLKDGWSVAGLASKVGVEPSHLSNVEGGRRGLSPAAIKRIADTLVIPISALLWHEEDVA